MKVLAFGASNSKQSINKTLAAYAAGLIEQAQVEVVDINDFEMPIYSIDRENESGKPELAMAFHRKIAAADALVISFAEHNGSYSAAFKNVIDWSSRLKEKIWNEKAMFLLATSPGARGGSTVLNLASTYFPFMGAKVEASFSLLSFYDNFSAENGIKNAELNESFREELNKFQSAI